MGENAGDDAGGNSDKDLEARLKRLSADIAASDARNTEETANARAATDASDEMNKARAAGFRILGEFTAAIVAGLMIGWIIDRIAGTSPAFLIVFLVLGTAAGFWNIYRIASPPKGPDR